jgi:GTP-binding protein
VTKPTKPTKPTFRKSIAGDRLYFLGSYPDTVPVLGLPEVAFAGRSNVGKSSAINKLLGTNKAARVSSTPGRTQTVNLFEVERRLVIADLPGYGFAKVPEAVQERWKALVEGYLTDRQHLKLAVVLLDPRRKPQEMDATLLWGLREARIPLLVLATKIDKLKRSKVVHQVRQLRQAYGLKDEECVPFSSLNGSGVKRTWEIINAAVKA